MKTDRDPECKVCGVNPRCPPPWERIQCSVPGCPHYRDPDAEREPLKVAS